jgi:EmrB/QacA subfamily drug resistance transporter
MPPSGSSANPHPRRWVALAILVAAQFMFVVDAFIVNVAIPSLRMSLAASGSQIEAIIAVYQIAYAAVLITGGRLGDLYERKRLFLIGLLGFTGASAWCSIAGSPVILIIARAAQGATAALMVPQVLASIQTLFPDEERAQAFGVVGVALGLGAAAGLMLGGWLVTLNPYGLAWRSAFLINIPVGLAIAALALALVPALPAPGGARLDLPGIGVLVTGLVLVLGPVVFGHDLGWPWWAWPMLVLGLATLAGFLRLEAAVCRRGRDPLINPALLLDRPFTTGLGATFSLYMGFTSFLLSLSLLLQNGLGFPAQQAGFTSGPLAVAFLISSRLAVRLSALNAIGVVMAGCAILSIALAGLGAMLFLMPHPTVLALALPLAVYGFGQGFVISPLLNIVLAKVKKAPAGAASGVLMTVQQIAGAAGIAVVGTVYFTVSAAYPTDPDWAGFLASLTALLAMNAVSLGFLLRLQRPRGEKL